MKDNPKRKTDVVSDYATPLLGLDTISNIESTIDRLDDISNQWISLTSNSGAGSIAVPTRSGLGDLGIGKVSAPNSPGYSVWTGGISMIRGTTDIQWDGSPGGSGAIIIPRQCSGVYRFSGKINFSLSAELGVSELSLWRWRVGQGVYECIAHTVSTYMGPARWGFLDIDTIEIVTPWPLNDWTHYWMQLAADVSGGATPPSARPGSLTFNAQRIG